MTQSYIVRADDLNMTKVDFMTADASSMTLKIEPKGEDNISLLGHNLTYIWNVETAGSHTKFELTGFVVQYVASQEKDAPVFEPNLPSLVQVFLKLDQPVEWYYELPPTIGLENSLPIEISVD